MCETSQEGGTQAIMKRKISMPYWCVGNPVGDPFGPGILGRISSLEVTDLLVEAHREGLIDFSAGHDCDLVPWDPSKNYDDRDEKSTTFQTLSAIKEKLDRAGIQFKMISCNLHSDPIFRNGGISNPDPRIRVLASQKVMRALRIGHFLGAEYYTYWVARDGFECQFSVPWEQTYRFLSDGLDLVSGYVQEENLGYRGGTVEYKPNEPRGESFLPTVGHSLALIARLQRPDFWGVNPEVLQHDQMTGLTSIGAVAFAAAAGKLFFIHVGNQKPNQFDNDNPPLVGMDGIKEFVSILYVLERIGWEGYIEFDNHPLRTDTAPGGENRLNVRRDYIRLAVESYRAAEAKAEELAGDKNIQSAQRKIWETDPRAEEVLASGSPSAIASYQCDYQSLVRERLGIGELDLLVARRLFGQ